MQGVVIKEDDATDGTSSENGISSPSVEPQHVSSFAIETTARSQNADGKCSLTPLRIYIFMCLSLFSYIHQQVLCIQ